MSESDLLSQAEFAKRFGEYTLGRPISLPTLRQWTKSGRLPSPVYVGRFPRYSWGAAMRWLDKRLEKAEQRVV